jgi:RNA-directed DNA polymerase
VRLIRKWLKAGVIENGEWSVTPEGTAQGASVSPLLANVYLHYVFDLWADQWRRRHAHGDVIIVRFADDYIVGFEHRDDAERFHAELRSRLARFSLELASEKTRLIEFGRFATEGRGLGRRRSRSWASRISAGRPRTGAFSSRASPRRSGCRRSYARSRPS